MKNMLLEQKKIKLYNKQHLVGKKKREILEQVLKMQ